MWFKKKQLKAETEKLPAENICNHKFRDFNWYMLYNYELETNKYEIKIYEPYVCILCKHREDKLLERITGFGSKELDKKRDEMFHIYPKLKGISEVQDEINDMLMVDPYYLDAYYKLHPEMRPADDSNRDKRYDLLAKV